MEALKKYAALLFLLITLPIARFAANNLMLEASNDIYAFIPQESDFVVEINMRNFASEMAYQRIFREDYFMEKVYPPSDDEPESKLQKTGIDPFGKVVLFREQWANETIWIALIKYTDEAELKAFMNEQSSDCRYEFSDGYAIVQLTPSSQQDKVDEHLEKIRKKEVKRFTERVNLSEIFNPKKEVNCYIIPKTTPQNKLLDGYLAFDFLGDHIAVEGSFTPIPEFGELSSVAYTVDDSKAFSMRSSLNVFNSIYWFNEEKIDNVPEYKQMAFDYDGVTLKMVHKSAGFSMPFKSYPQVSIHFDLLESEIWQGFVDSLEIKNHIRIDTANNRFVTPEGAHFNYTLTDQIFRIKQDSFSLTVSDAEKLYFDLHMVTDQMIDNTIIEVDEENPPGKTEQQLGMMAARGMMGEIKKLATMEYIDFQLTGGEDNIIKANGRIEMKDKEGHSVIESLSFGAAVFNFLKSYL